MFYMSLPKAEHEATDSNLLPNIFCRARHTGDTPRVPAVVGVVVVVALLLLLLLSLLLLGLLDSESGLHRGRQLALCQPQLHADFEGIAFGTLNSVSFQILFKHVQLQF